MPEERSNPLGKGNELRFRWLLYVCLILGAIYDLLYAERMFSDRIYGDVTQFVYENWVAAHAANVFSGVVMLIMTVSAIFACISISTRRAGTWKQLRRYYATNAAVQIIHSVVLQLTFTERLKQLTGEQNAVNWTETLIVVSAFTLMGMISGLYLRKNKEYFNK